MGTAGLEIRHALRALWKSPGFTAAAALTLALGVGANSAIFSVIDKILLRPLPYRDSGRMVMVWETQKVNPNEFADPERVKAMRHWMIDNTAFERWRQQSQSFESMAAYRWGSYGLSGGGEPERVEGGIISAGFFPLLGVQPMLGRAFTQEEDQPGNNQVVILSHRIWMKRFGGNRGIVGAKVLVEGAPHTVLGVMPKDFDPILPTLSKEIDVWVPSTHEMKTGRPFDIYYVGARLKPGVPTARAAAELTGVLKGLAAESPRRYAGKGVNIVPMAEEIAGDIRPALLVLLGASGCVLLIACANLANLLLTRSLTRQRELGIRTVLGANRWALMRQPLLESGIVGLAGGILGLFLTGWGVRVLIAAAPKYMLPRSGAIGLDARVLFFGLLVSLAAGLLAGVLPAWQASRLYTHSDVGEALKETGRSSQSGRGRRIRNVLVVAEMALALVLLVGAGLLVRSFARLTSVDLGFRTDNVLTMKLALPASKYRAAAAQAQFADEVLQRASGIPGVQTAAITNSLPLDPVIVMSWTMMIEGRPQTEDNQTMVYFRAVSPDYFRTMGQRLRRGTLFVDRPGVEPAVINEAMVRRYWPEAREGSLEPIGRRINVARRWRVIVGVVSDIKFDDPARATAAEVYVPFHTDAGPWMTLVARVSGDPMRLGSAFRNAVWAVDRDQAVYDIQPLDRVVYASVAKPRFRMALLGIFASLALALAAVGIYGVMAYAVAQRTHEIGIRMALGAERGNVLRMVVREGLMLAAAGVVLGIAGALAATRVLNSFLFGVTATDVRTLAAVSILLAAVAAAASYVPARRATRVDPNVALRWE